MFNFFKKWRKKKEFASLQEVEHMLNSASYKPLPPTPEFKQKLMNKLLQARRRNKSSFMEKAPFFTFNWKVWVPAISFAVIILLLLPLVAPLIGQEKFFIIDRAYAQSAIEITAEKSDQSGVDAATSFKITTKIPVDSGDLRDHIRFEPQMDFDFNKISDTEFELIPQQPLAPGVVYNVVVDAAYRDLKGIVIPKEFRFAFQVKDTFKILKTLPGDKQQHADIDTGIELTFSHPTVTAADLEKHFSIEPQTAGRFEKHGRALVFIPKKPLTEQTLYTVKVAAGMPLSQTEQTLGKDYSFQFFTRLKDRPRDSLYFNLGYGNDFRVFAPSEKPMIFANMNENFPQDTKVKLYRANSFEELQKRMNRPASIPSWVCLTCLGTDLDTKGLPVALETTIGDIASKISETRFTLTLPEIKERGIYVFEVVGEKEPFAQSIIQISNLKVYATTSKEKSFVWVNHAQTKKGVDGAAVSFVNQKVVSVKTDSAGLAVFETPKCAEGQFYSYDDFLGISSGEENVYLGVGASCNVNYNPNQDPYFWGVSEEYWTSFSTDRRVYLPTDEVYFWGIAKSRKAHKPQAFTVELRSSQDAPDLVMQVHTNDLGTYEGKFELKGMPPQYYTVTIRDSRGTAIDNGSIEVATFQKPLYDLKAEALPQAVFIGEPLKVKLTAKFFEGTPAGNLALQYHDNLTELKNVKTDKNGEVEISVDTSKVPPSNPQYGSNSYWSQFSFNPASAEYGLSEEYGNFIVYRSDLDIQIDYERGKQNNKISGKVGKLDLSKYGTDEFYKPAGAPKQELKGEIIREYEEKIEDGEFYDSISKKVTPRYRFERKHERVQDFAVVTDREGKFSYEFSFDKTQRYRVALTTKDSKGREARDVREFWSVYEYGFVDVDEEKNVTLRDTKNIQDSGIYHRYDLGEKVELQVYVNEKPSEEKGSYLYYQAQSGIRKVIVSDSPKYEFTFGEEHVPNVELDAVWFDGKYYRSSRIYGGGTSILFKTDARRLSIEVTPDKENYRPGETARLAILAKNAKGNPVAAEVNVKLVDEAIYALGEFDGDPLFSLYRSLPSGILSVVNTAPAFFPEDEGGKGGGDGSEFRRLFKNTALFTTARTSGNGRAEVSVKLPDDLTTFRVTSQGVTENLDAGISKSKVKVSLPFSVDLTVNDSYLTSDEPSVRLRVFGKDVKEGAQAAYEISVPSLGVESQKITAKAGEPYWYKLPKLAIGKHEIRVKAESNGQKDAIAKTVSVVDSLLTLPVSETRPLSPGVILSDFVAPRAKLLFSLSPYDEYYEKLTQLKWVYSGRLDAKVSAIAARELLAKYFGEQNEEPTTDFTGYQSFNGGLKLLPYDDSDLDLSYRAAFILPQGLNEGLLERYFDEVLENENPQYKNRQASNREEIVMALAGKAALRRPILNQLKMFLEIHKSQLTTREKLIAAFGLAAIGDAAVANSLLEEVMKDKVKVEGDSVLLELTKDREENVELTARAAAVASLASHVDAEKLWNAVRRYESQRTLTSIEQSIALSSALSHLPPVQKGSFKYSLPGRSEKMKLLKAETFSMFVTQEDFKNLNFSEVEGPVAVTIYFDAPFAQANPQLSSSIKVSRHYEVDGKRTAELREGQFVRVVLEATVSGEKERRGFEVIDTLPTGLLPATSVRTEDFYYGENKRNTSYPHSVEGQRLSFRMYGNSELKEISYFARVVSKGIFTAEPALMQAVDNKGRLMISNAAKVEIK